MLDVGQALHALFQMMFACITPLLMTGILSDGTDKSNVRIRGVTSCKCNAGAYAERLRFDCFLAFTVVWEVRRSPFDSQHFMCPKFESCTEPYASCDGSR